MQKEQKELHNRSPLPTTVWRRKASQGLTGSNIAAKPGKTGRRVASH